MIAHENHLIIRLLKKNCAKSGMHTVAYIGVDSALCHPIAQQAVLLNSLGLLQHPVISLPAQVVFHGIRSSEMMRR